MAAAKSAVATATHRPRTLVSAWLFLSSFVVAWDIGYILMRPRSFLGGDLHWLWSPYSLYMNIDYIYGLPAWDAKDGFPAAQTLMNVVESILNLFYVYLVHVRATPSSRAVAPIYGLITVTMTLSKTILYVLNVSRSCVLGKGGRPTHIHRLPCVRSVGLLLRLVQDWPQRLVHAHRLLDPSQRSLDPLPRHHRLRLRQGALHDAQSGRWSSRCDRPIPPTLLRCHWHDRCRWQRHTKGGGRRGSQSGSTRL